MNKLIVKHHSLADWDFKPGHRFFLSDAQFVSAPTSLCCPNEDGWSIDWVYLKPVVCGDLPNARFITKSRYHAIGYYQWDIFFRAQALPVGNFPEDCYYIMITSTQIRMWRRVEGDNTDLVTMPIDPGLTPDVWYTWRLTFGTTYSEGLEKIFRIILDLDRGGGYEQQFSHDCGLNLWEESGTNRIGFDSRQAYDQFPMWWDNTEIWVPA